MNAISQTARPSTLVTWISATRPKTLLASVAPVAVGTFIGAGGSEHIQWLAAGGCLIGAILIQIATNFINDAADGVNGTDDEYRLGPQRAVAAGWISARRMWLASAIVLILAFVLGLWLSTIGGWPIFIGGCISLLCAIAYTAGPFPLAYHGLGDVFVLLFFGLFAVLGAAWIQNPWAEPPLAHWLLAVALGCQATALIAINNIRDRAGDERARKRTLAVRLGHTASLWYHLGLHVAATACIGYVLGMHAATLVAGVGGAALSLLVFRLHGSALNKCLGMGALLELATAAALVWAWW